MPAWLIVFALLLTTPAFAESSLWQSANGSTIEITESGDQVTMTYHDPNYELMKNGARRGSLAFSGRRSGDQITGTAYTYMSDCPQLTSSARGLFRDAQTLTVTAERPINLRNCVASSYITYSANLTRMTTITQPTNSAPAAAPTPTFVGIDYTPSPPIDYSISLWVRLFGAATPFLEILIAVLGTAWVLIAIVDLPPTEPGRSILWTRPAAFALLLAGYIGLYLASGLYEQIEREHAAIKQARSQLEHTINTSSPSPQRNDAILTLRTKVPTGSPGSVLAFFLSPILLLFLLYPLAFVRGYHYLFVGHPAAAVAVPAMRSGSLFDNVKLADALDPVFAQAGHLPPAYKLRDMLSKANILKERIETDGEIADAAMRRDRARAAMLQAKDDLRKAKGKKKWWFA